MTGIRRPRGISLALIGLVVMFATTSTYSQNFSVVYNFGTVSGDPANPGWGGIWAQSRDGNMYTESTSGGAHSQGAVFEGSPVGNHRVRYSFCSQPNCADGFNTWGGLTLGTDGNFYGTAWGGGLSGAGTVFQITPTGSLTVLYNFTNNLDGGFPYAVPIQGTDGSFYGTADLGGSGACGTVYKITTSGVFSVLFGFDRILHGCSPIAALILGTDGNFYGVTQSGGSANDGVVFQITPGGSLTVLYNFDGVHGTAPFGKLVQGSDGNFYGTTTSGGTSNSGVVFQITPLGTLTVLHNLNGTTDGGHPYAGLVQATDGNFYGVAKYGGNSTNCSGGCGTVFRITAAGSYSVLYNFDSTTGALPMATPFQHTNGRLYGDTAYGGTGHLCQGGSTGCGVLYSLDASLPAFVTLLPYSAKVGAVIEFLGQGFTSATTVSFNGTPATKVGRVFATYLRAVVPNGATTGYVTVTTSGSTLTSNKPFVVTP